MSERREAGAARVVRNAADLAWREALRVALSLALTVAALFPISAAGLSGDGAGFSMWGMPGALARAPGPWGGWEAVFLIGTVWTIVTLVATVAAMVLPPSVLSKRVCVGMAWLLGCFAVGQLCLIAIANGGIAAADSDVLRNWLLCAVLGGCLSISHGTRSADPTA